MYVVKEFPELGIKLEQSEARAAYFRLTYGKQVTPNMTYATTCKELGAALLHALACEGKLNNEGV